MDTRSTLLQAIHAQPTDEVAWLALADWLEENGETGRAELLRLHRSLPRLRYGPARYRVEERIQRLLAEGIRPCVPTLVNSLGMELVLIPPGTFRMGSPSKEPRRMDDETLHDVTLTKPYYLGVYPVTQSEYRSIMGQNPSYFNRRRIKDPTVDFGRCPVERVQWDQAVAFCQELSAARIEAHAGRRYRLPTEAEWEYACRAWGAPRYPFHLGMSLEGHQANFHSEHPFPPEDGNVRPHESLKRTCEVGRYAPNAFGLYDLHGNVDEWVADRYDPEYYRYSPERDPQGPEHGNRRVVRGGSWGGQGEDCRTAVRIGYEPDETSSRVGFRVVMTKRD